MEPEIWGQRPLWECLAWALSQDLSLPAMGALCSDFSSQQTQSGVEGSES